MEAIVFVACLSSITVGTRLDWAGSPIFAEGEAVLSVFNVVQMVRSVALHNVYIWATISFWSQFPIYDARFLFTRFIMHPRCFYYLIVLYFLTSAVGRTPVSRSFGVGTTRLLLQLDSYPIPGYLATPMYVPHRNLRAVIYASREVWAAGFTTALTPHSTFSNTGYSLVRSASSAYCACLPLASRALGLPPWLPITAFHMFS